MFFKFVALKRQKSSDQQIFPLWEFVRDAECFLGHCRLTDLSSPLQVVLSAVCFIKNCLFMPGAFSQRVFDSTIKHKDRFILFVSRCRFPSFLSSPVFLNRTKRASTPSISREKPLKDFSKPPTQQERTGQTSDSRCSDINLSFFFRGEH